MTKNLINRDNKFIAGIEKIRFFPIAPVGGEGCYIIEENGRRLLDFAGSWGAAGLGYSHPAITEAITRASQSMASSSLLSYASEPAITLAEELLSIVPGGTPRKVWFGHSGSDANDMIVRLLEASTGRKKFITFHGAYHGGVTGSMSISGHSSQEHSPKREGVIYLPYPNPYRPQFDDNLSENILKRLDELFDTSCPPKEVAAVFIEPIQSDGGVIVPPYGFMKSLEKRCKTYGIQVVVDEVKVGLGRSGLMHAFEHEDLTPDFISFGKALGGGLPLSAVVGPTELMDFAPAFSIMTASGNPVSVSAGRTVLKTIQNEDLIANAKFVGKILQEGFKQLANKHELIGDVRGRGLAIGVELVSDRYKDKKAAKLETAKVVYRAYELGLVIFYVGMESNVLELTPPLIMSEKEANLGLEILDKAFTDVSNGLVSESAIEKYKGW
jgi:4-aminobutyrate aminotransferase|tara:strand:+ start:134 stop:1456 length:1323 start_codon:yes stop_codon:yes gene_type:complete